MYWWVFCWPPFGASVSHCILWQHHMTSGDIICGLNEAMHDVVFFCVHSHFAVTHKPWVWKLLGAVNECMTGISMYVWTHQHVVGHHAYTNIDQVDPDVFTTHVRSMYTVNMHTDVYIPSLFRTHQISAEFMCPRKNSHATTINIFISFSFIVSWVDLLV